MIYMVNMNTSIFIGVFMEFSSNSESFSGLFFNSILFNVSFYDDIRVLQPFIRSYMAANVTPVKAFTVEDKVHHMKGTHSRSA